MNFAFLFPGQGSQSVGMLGEYAKGRKEIAGETAGETAEKILAQTFEQASTALSQDLFKLVSEGPQEELNLTVNTQPAILTASVAVWRIWNSLTDITPDIMAGHSLGEYSALTCAGVFEFEDAVKVVRKRAELMQAAVPAPHGAMAVVVGLEAERVIELCAEASESDVVEAVNFNAATQTVVAGHAAAVQRLIELAKQAKARRYMLLPISVPAHSSLLKDAAHEFEQFLSDVPMQEPGVPVVHNTDVRLHPAVGEIRQALAAQLHTPVRWLETIKHMSDKSVQILIEVGPGRVLTGLNRRIDKTLDAFDTDTLESMENGLKAVESCRAS